MYNKLFDLSKKVILITGGGGHLGRELSIGISDFHAQVIAVGRKKSTFNSKKIEYIECDLKDEEEFEEEETGEARGGGDVGVGRGRGRRKV